MNPGIGTEGYVIFDYSFNAPGYNLTNLATGFSLTNASGWNIWEQHLSWGISVDGSFQTNTSNGIIGWQGNPAGNITLNVPDTNYHFLTVLSPDIYNDNRAFLISLISTNGTSAQYSVNDTEGNSYMFQFLFKGNVTLNVDQSGGSNSTIQALFVDNFPVASPSSIARPLPPTDLQLVIP